MKIESTSIIPMHNMQTTSASVKNNSINTLMNLVKLRIEDNYIQIPLYDSHLLDVNALDSETGSMRYNSSTNVLSFMQNVNTSKAKRVKFTASITLEDINRKTLPNISKQISQNVEYDIWAKLEKESLNIYACPSITFNEFCIEGKDTHQHILLAQTTEFNSKYNKVVTNL